MNKQLKIGTRGIEWTERDQGWLEAFIDSEGHISLLTERRPKFTAGVAYKPRVGIANKNLDMINKARSMCGGGAIFRARSGVYNLDMSANVIRRFLPRLRLIAKERQRLILISALSILSKRTGRGIGPRSKTDINRLESRRLAIRRLNNTAHRYEQTVKN